MLSPVIREMIERRVGFEIRYPSDCEHLAEDIATATRQHIGVTTLKRLLGFVGGVCQPRLSTLDIVARYIGYRNYHEVVASLAPTSKAMIEQLQAAAVAPGTNVCLGYCAGSLWVESLGNQQFRVKKSSDRQLHSDDVITVSTFRLRYPLFIHNVERNGAPLGQCVVAGVSGIVQIETY